MKRKFRRENDYEEIVAAKRELSQGKEKSKAF